MTAVYEMVDGRPYVDGRLVVMAMEIKYENSWLPLGASAFCHRSFCVPLENGMIVSTIWGTGTYSDNHVAFLSDGCEFIEHSLTAEMAAWWNTGDARGPLLTWPDGDSVVGYVPAEIWWGLLDMLAEVPTGSELSDYLRGILA